MQNDTQRPEARQYKQFISKDQGVNCKTKEISVYKV